MLTLKNKQSGFTLIELMIVVAIIGILLSIAYPSYSHHIMKSKRVEGMSELMQAAQLQEKYYSQKLKYAYDIKSLYGNPALGAKKLTENELYGISLTATDSEGAACTSASSCIAYTLTATAESAKSQHKDTACRLFTIAHTGEKTAKNSSNEDTTSSCW